jgi:hypothetical protein
MVVATSLRLLPALGQNGAGFVCRRGKSASCTSNFALLVGYGRVWLPSQESSRAWKLSFEALEYFVPGPGNLFSRVAKKAVVGFATEVFCFCGKSAATSAGMLFEVGPRH